MNRRELHPEMTEAAKQRLDAELDAAAKYRNSEPVAKRPASKRRGRPPGPRRCVVQMRVRNAGKVQSWYSVTLHAEPSHVMKELQVLAERYRDAGKLGGARGKGCAS